MRICTSLAPAERSKFTIRPLVVPRTMESSMRTMRLPFTSDTMGLSFIRTRSIRFPWPGEMKVRPM